MFQIAPAGIILLTTVLADGGTTTPPVQDLSGMAASVLAVSDVARQAVRQHDQTAALNYVLRAQTMAAEIQAKGANQPQPLFVPVHTSTTTTTTYNDVKRTKNAEFTASRMKRNTHVSDVSQETVTDELDITTAQDNLGAAYAAIQREDWASADADLAAVDNLLHINTSDNSLPLLQAHQNLEIARARVVNKEYKAAVAPLRAAEHALSDFEQRDRGPFVQQAEDMRQAIEIMAINIVRRASSSQIDDWVSTLERWENTRKSHLYPPPPF